MVDTDIHNWANDTDLDLPSLPDAHRRTARRGAKRKPGRKAIAADHYRWNGYPRSRLPSLIDGLLGLPLPTDVAKAPEGRRTPWHVRLCWTQRIHCLRVSEYGCGSQAVLPCLFYGKRTVSGGYLEGGRQFRRSVAMGVSIDPYLLHSFSISHYRPLTNRP